MDNSKPTSTRGRGYLIVVEGLDRAGKTTQCGLLCEDIRGEDGDEREVKYQKFPGKDSSSSKAVSRADCIDRTTVIGQMINSYLQGKTNQNDQAIHLLFSANRWEAVQSILADLEAGCTVVIDRYSFSGAVYTAAKDNPDLSLDWCWSPEIGLPQPDLVLFLDISSDDAAKRGGYGEERYEQEEMQAKVRALFQLLFLRLPDLNVRNVNAGLSQKEVSDQIWSAFQDLEKTNARANALRSLISLSPV